MYGIHAENRMEIEFDVSFSGCQRIASKPAAKHLAAS